MTLNQIGWNFNPLEIQETSANIALPQSGRTEVRSTSYRYCSSVIRWTDFQLAFVS